MSEIRISTLRDVVNPNPWDGPCSDEYVANEWAELELTDLEEDIREAVIRRAELMGADDLDIDAIVGKLMKNQEDWLAGQDYTEDLEMLVGPERYEE